MALIVAIGSQNAYVLRQGIRREHVLVLVPVFWHRCFGPPARGAC